MRAILQCKGSLNKHSAFSMQPSASRAFASLAVSAESKKIIADTLPLVANVGPDFTKHFYKRLFDEHPALLNVFNKTNQAIGLQSTRIFFYW